MPHHTGICGRQLRYETAAAAQQILRTTGIFKGTPHGPAIYMRLSKFRACMILTQNYAARNQKSRKTGK